jgi:hypothetical protein
METKLNVKTKREIYYSMTFPIADKVNNDRWINEASLIAKFKEIEFRLQNSDTCWEFEIEDLLKEMQVPKED